MKTFDHVVIGGGFSGLLAALRASDIDQRVLIIEANDYLGGLVKKAPIGKSQIDLGAESFSIIKDDLLALVIELELESKLVIPNSVGAYLLTSGSRIEIPKGYLGVPMNLDDPVLREIFSESEIAEAKRLDSLPFGFESGTVFDLITSRLGEAFNSRLVEPVLAGVHGSSSQNLDAEVIFASILPKALELGSLVEAVNHNRMQLEKSGSTMAPGSAVMGLLGGMTTLIEALVERLTKESVVFELGSNVESIFRVEDQWRVTTKNGSVLAKRMSVCTGPAAVSKLFKSAVGLAAERFNVVDVAVVGVLVQSAQLNSNPLGTGALIAKDQGFLAKATTHTSAKWSWIKESLPKDKHLIRLSYGRDGEIPNGDLEALAKAELGLIYGISDHKVLESVSIFWPGALVQSNQKVISDFQQATENLEAMGIEFCGAFLSGNGLLGLVNQHNKRRNA